MMQSKVFNVRNRGHWEFMRCLRSLLIGCLLASSCLAQDASRFEKEALASGLSDPLQLDIAKDGRVFFVERNGAVKMWGPTSRRTVTIGDFPAATNGDAGALGLTLARDFEPKSGDGARETRETRERRNPSAG